VITGSSTMTKTCPLVTAVIASQPGPHDRLREMDGS
jgi:hypothetical protein